MTTHLIKFKIKDGQIYIKCPKVTPEEYKKIATQIHRIVNLDVLDVLQQHNFNASIKVDL